jgi:DNA polymerase III delta prime subunit
MDLIEHKYIPHDINDIITPNKEAILDKIHHHITTKNMNLLLIGSPYTFKSNTLHLIIKEYYKREGIENYAPLTLSLDCFNDINFSNLNNDVNTFCKTNSFHKKFLIIDNFDIISEGNQQYLKILMETCKNTFFLFSCENTNKINEIIQTRVTPIYFDDLNKENYVELITHISKGENVFFDIEPLINHSNISPYYIYNIFNKIKLLNEEEIDINKYILTINYDIFDRYIQFISKKDVKAATHILFELFDSGYSLLDIYYFFYEYIKLSQNANKYNLIEQVCLYIQYIYDGFDNKLMLLFFTNDIIVKYNNNI